MKPGIYYDIPIEVYHASPGISKTGLWTIHSKSPAHYKFGFREKKAHFDYGEACHLAVLQPEAFEKKVYRGPIDRRGNKWKDAMEFCAAEGQLLLTERDYDQVATIRDAVHSDAWLNTIITGGKADIEATGAWKDEQTGMLCRCRPDLYREDLGLILDLKTSTSAHPDAFARFVVNYGYHAQEAFYSDGWRNLGKKVEGWVFLVLEKSPPYVHAVYELPPSIVEEGRMIMRKALDTFAKCVREKRWPGYGDGVQELSFARWSYREIDAPELLDEELPA